MKDSAKNNEIVLTGQYLGVVEYAGTRFMLVVDDETFFDLDRTVNQDDEFEVFGNIHETENKK